MTGNKTGKTGLIFPATIQKILIVSFTLPKSTIKKCRRLFRRVITIRLCVPHRFVFSINQLYYPDFFTLKLRSTNE